MKRTLVISLALALSACASSGTKVEQSKAAQLQVGVTTYAQTVALLGKPNSVGIDSAGNKTAVYTYAQAQVSPLNFVPIVGMFARSTTTEHSAFTATFDSTDHLVRYFSSEGGSDVGYGLVSGQRQ